MFPAACGTPEPSRTTLRSDSAFSANSARDCITSEDFKTLFGTDFQPSPDLIKAIEAKQCIAFVGAGFTAPITSLTWKSLLSQMLEQKAYPNFLRKNLVERYSALQQKLAKERPTVEDFSLVAQEMQDILGERVFDEFICEKCKLKEETVLQPDMVHRIRCLSRIPFKAIITTNYNSLFSGLEKNVEPALHNGSINPCKHWESILRGSSGQDNFHDDQQDIVDSASSATWGDQDSEENNVDSFNEVKETMTLKQALEKFKFRCPILKIHGCVEYPNSIVLSRTGYKRLQYETPGLKLFVTSAMATHTVLYIGFSFTDDYLNEFRAEVLKMLRPAPRVTVQFNVVLQALKSIGKPHLLSCFHDKCIHDELLQDFNGDSSQSSEISQKILSIEGIEQGHCKAIEQFVKDRVPATNRRPCDISELDKEAPIAYAIIDSKSQQEIDYLRRHEAVEIMTWTANGWFGGCDAYLDAILRQTSRPFMWGSLLTKSILENGNKVIITWDLGQDEKKKVGWWLCQCVEFYRNASRHQHSLYTEATKRKEKQLRTPRTDGTPASPSNSAPPIPADCSSPEALLQRKQSGGGYGSDLVVPVDSVETLRQKLREYGERVACVICPFGQSETLKLCNYSREEWGEFVSAPHIVRLVQQEVSGLPPQLRCPFIVYANPRKDKHLSRWRQECAMRCGAFGYASRTDKLFEYLKSVTDVYLPPQ